MISVALIFLNISKICNGKLNTLVTAIFTRHFDLADLEDEENAIRPLASHDQLITYKRLILCKVNYDYVYSISLSNTQSGVLFTSTIVYQFVSHISLLKKNFPGFF